MVPPADALRHEARYADATPLNSQRLMSCVSMSSVGAADVAVGRSVVCAHNGAGVAGKIVYLPINPETPLSSLKPLAQIIGDMTRELEASKVRAKL